MCGVTEPGRKMYSTGVAGDSRRDRIDRVLQEIGEGVVAVVFPILEQYEEEAKSGHSQNLNDLLERMAEMEKVRC